VSAIEIADTFVKRRPDDLFGFRHPVVGPQDPFAAESDAGYFPTGLAEHVCLYEFHIFRV
jgi:hypothetical protein